MGIKIMLLVSIIGSSLNALLSCTVWIDLD